MGARINRFISRDVGPGNIPVLPQRFGLVPVYFKHVLISRRNTHLPD